MALDVISTTTQELAHLQHDLKIADDDFEIYLEEERTYLEGLKNEPPEMDLRFWYVEALEALDDLAHHR
jgi:hypothetical protein